MTKCLLDSSSAILLYKTGLLLKFLGVYQVVMAEAVFEELTLNGYPGAQDFFQLGSVGTVTIMASPEKSQFDRFFESDRRSMDRGERETLRCFAIGAGELIITDDGKAARFCRTQGIPYSNALLFPRLLYLSDQLSEKDCRHKMNELIRIGRYSSEVIDFAMNCFDNEIKSLLP